MKDSLMTRRTIRQYSGRDVEPELLNQLLAASARTQTSFVHSTSVRH